MGSAFPAEPLYGVDAHEVVTFLQWPNDTNTDVIIHLRHPECAIDHPHRIRDCGRFAPPRHQEH